MNPTNPVQIRLLSPSELPLYQQLLELRNNQLRKPIGLDLFKEDLSKETNETIIVATAHDDCTIGHRIIGCVMLSPIPGEPVVLKLPQMAVTPEYQGKGIGSNLVQFAQEYSKRQGIKRIYLHARKHACSFYKKLGYDFVSEKEFIEVGIPHLAMEKTFP